MSLYIIYTIYYSLQINYFKISDFKVFLLIKKDFN